MPRFNLNVRTESHIAATMIVEKDDLHSLRLEMAQFVGNLLKNHAELIWSDEDWQIDVSDDRGLIIYAMHVSAFKTPATTGFGN